eukprot:g5571.t1
MRIIHWREVVVKGRVRHAGGTFYRSSAAHVYQSAGVYAVVIRGALDQWTTPVAEQVEASAEVLRWRRAVQTAYSLGKYGQNLFAGLFTDAARLQSLPVPSLLGQYLVGVTSMRGMFLGAVALNDLDTTGWDLSTVTDLSEMFKDCGALTSIHSLADWDTRKVKDFSHMFAGAKNFGLTNGVAAWDVSQCTSLAHMFDGAENADPSVANWQTSKVTNFSGLFASTKRANPSLGAWNVTEG